MTMMNTVMDQVARMDSAELNRVVDAVKMRRTFIAKESARGLFIGDAVSFEGKRGTVQGTVTKVTASMLTLLAA